jgi:hypothetical protein
MAYNLIREYGIQEVFDIETKLRAFIYEPFFYKLEFIDDFPGVDGSVLRFIFKGSNQDDEKVYINIAVTNTEMDQFKLSRKDLGIGNAVAILKFTFELSKFLQKYVKAIDDQKLKEFE